MLITAPIPFPVAVGLGMHPVHLGILMIVNMEVGMCHPPVGLNLYVASGMAKMGITELTIAVWPWLLTMLCFLVAVTYVPEMSLWLPRILGMLWEAFSSEVETGWREENASRKAMAALQMLVVATLHLGKSGHSVQTVS